jgi:hypothetical protein
MSNHHFLKCTNCGYLTEIVRENHSWCYNCTKRFSNYYKLWKTQNNGQNLEAYQKDVCEKITDLEIKSFVNPQNKKVEIKNPSKNLIIRRRYIDEGIPLDRGGHFEWDINQIKKFRIPMLIIIVALILLMILLE